VNLDTLSRNITFVGKETTLYIFGLPVKSINYFVHKYVLRKNILSTAVEATPSSECRANVLFGKVNCNKIVTQL